MNGWPARGGQFPHLICGIIARSQPELLRVTLEGVGRGKKYLNQLEESARASIPLFYE